LCRKCGSQRTPGGMKDGKLGTSIQTPQKAQLSDYLAAERTFLAWIRTGLALMGFGFVVARFGLFLEELRVSEPVLATQSYGVSLWFGTAMIAVGVVVNIYSAWHHARLIRDLDRGGAGRSRSSAAAVVIALFLALTGLAMTIYLISFRTAARTNSGTKKETLMAPSTEKGITNIPSNHSVEQTVEKLKGILQAKGVALFALVDHSGEAEKAGLRMPPTKLLIFGSPKAGTPVMLAAPSSAIDLPLKILVWEDGQGKTWLSYNTLAYLQQRHGIPQELLPNLAAVETLAAKTGE
jgi:uncharacterized protein (DUF302 family)/uncharacterized membrane protein YidH (DUF202 family)